MTGDMRDNLERELRQHAAALRGLARDLVGASDADDVVQETALQALRMPPARGGALGGWLAGIVRHVASRHRRAEARRVRRESAVAREPIAAGAGAGEGDMLRFLTEAVLALPQPYRSALFARYLKDLDPAEIAAQTGEPVGTIKTRLKRGLVLLRERFDAREREHGGDWRAAFLGAFGLERVTAGTAAAGVIVMTAASKWALGGVAAAIAIAGTLVFSPLLSPAAGPAPASASDPVLAQTGAPRAAPADTAQMIATAAADLERTAAGPKDPPSAAEASACIVRGRCVDEAGAPRAGVHARLSGRGGNTERIAAWKLLHGEPTEVDQRAETGADGAFVFRLASLSPLMFGLALDGRGLARWRCSWNELAAGTTDLGDVVLAPGTVLRGRVVDADGAPVPDVGVHLERTPWESRDRGYEQQCSTSTRKDGSFRMYPLLAGDYKLGIDDQVIERPAVVALTGEPEQFVDVALKRLDDADAIRGIVVDDEGAPVRHVTVSPWVSGSGRIVVTDSEGRFRVMRREGMPARLRLSVNEAGYEWVQTEEIAWGRSDVRIVVAKGKGFAVLVVRASDGAPVEDYVLRVMPAGGSVNSVECEPRGDRHHAGGGEAVTGVRVGPHQVIVAPVDTQLAIGVVRTEVIASGAAPVVVRLAATRSRTVRVQGSNGAVIAGATVRLVDPLGGTLTEITKARALGEWMSFTGRKGLVLTAATTDANGEATLRAPDDRPLGLLLPGPGHVPHTIANVVFPDDGPLVVTVSTGATLRGTIGPEAAFAEIRRRAGIDGDEPASSTAWPSIQLWRRDGAGTHDPFPERERCSVKNDGAFELTGVPPGRWRIVVLCLLAKESGGRFLEEDGGFVDVADGEIVAHTIDLSAVLPGELEGVVLRNGAPLASAPVQLRMRLADHPDRQSHHVEDVTTDDAGRFHAQVRTGEYELTWAPVREMGCWVTVVAGERARVDVGKRTQQTFALATGKVDVLVLDPSGKPVRNVVLQCRDAGDVARFSFAPTDAEGRTTIECDIAPFTICVLPKSLQDPAAGRAHVQARLGQRDPFTDVWLVVGRFTPRAGETVTVEVRLPPEWER
ncbi:MAG TPA: sigma factor-like helix-turn-helix DNA-binding protein [Planctomycetota bacterium]|nr:sigma factor-like helix-turn-helix DNA-binding protein [Planctomycetota bacterium]